MAGTTGFLQRKSPAGGSAWMFADPAGGAPLDVADSARNVPTATAKVQMQAGHPFYLRVE